MIDSTLWPYLLVIPATAIGILAGWYLQSALKRRMSQATQTKPPVRPRPVYPSERPDDWVQAVREAEAELARLKAELAAIAAARQRAQERIKERPLLPSRVTVESRARKPPAHQREIDDTLTEIDRSLDELDLLDHLKETYLAQIDRLTQQVQWQDSELRMLRQTIKAKTTEIEEAQALLEQRDAELRRLIRQRQQREVDLVRARQMLKQRDDELRRLLQHQSEGGVIIDAKYQVGPGERVDVTPGKQPMLQTGNSAIGDSFDDSVFDGVEDNNQEDDLSAIPGLAEFYARQLKAKGLKTFRQLAQAHPDDIEQMLDIPGHYSPDIASWIVAARKIVVSRRSKRKT